MNTLRNLLIIGLLFITMNSLAQPQRTVSEPLPTRQVHLDFHTSELIPGIGEKFDKKQFQDALKTGHINQINIFAKGHHGWSYYPTKIGNVHPNLKFDLLGAEIEACHEIGVKCPIYFTVGWSANDAETHPEWCARNKDGSYQATNWDFNAKITDVKPFTSWKELCPAAGGPYNELIKKQVEEICQKYPVDGFWFDIYHVKGCYCEFCLKRMREEGIDLNNPEEVIKSNALAVKAQEKELRLLIAKYYPNATIYFNGTPHVRNNVTFTERLFDLNTQQELEDLPTTWGGYDKLPLESKYHLGQGTPIVAMSGKFHKSWGEFGGFKNSDAIKYEAAAMISYGAACNFGDQLHPSGEMDMDTYRNIGEAYKYVEQIEQYGPGGVPVSRLGIWLTLDNNADRGVVNMLLETHKDFVIADEKNLDELEMVIIPGHPCLDDSQASLINNWVKKGGKLIVFGEGALDKVGKKFILDVGTEYLKKSDFNFDYTVVKTEIGKNVVTTPFLNYEAGLLVKLTSGKELATIREPYFNRTYEHYSSHCQTPYKLEDSQYPAVVRNGNVIFFTHNLDKLYFTHALRLDREMVNNAIDLLYKSPMLVVNSLPSCGRVSFLKQEKQNRYVAHLLYSPALQRGEVMVIEDFLPVPGVEIQVQVPEKIRNVYQIPGGKKLKYEEKGNRIIVKVPTFTMHTGIVLSY